MAEVELTAEEEQAVDEARAVFDQFMTAYNDVLTAGEPATDEVLNRILPYLLHPLQTEVHSEIFDSFQEDRRGDGRIDWSFIGVVDTDMDAVSEVAGEDRPSPTVRLQFCVDRTDWTTVEKATGNILHGPGSRSLTTATAILFDSTPVPVAEEELAPSWGISALDDEDAPC